MKGNKRNTTVATCLAVLALVAGSANGAISYQLITNDADSGISSSNTYTHAGDLSSGASPATFNGVTFSSNPANYSSTFNGFNSGSPKNAPTGGLGDLMQGFIFRTGTMTNGVTTDTITLGGLTAGTTYDFRIYSGQWSTSEDRTNRITFDPDGAGAISDSTTFNQNNATSVPGESFAADDIYYINYRYTAVTGEDLVVDFTVFNNDSASFHLYGFTNQVVPEPSSLLLAALGSSLLLRRRRQSQAR